MPVLPEQTAGAEPEPICPQARRGRQGSAAGQGLERSSRGLEPRSPVRPAQPQHSKEAKWSLGLEPELGMRSLQTEVSPSGPWIHSAGPPFSCWPTPQPFSSVLFSGQRR